MPKVPIRAAAAALLLAAALTLASSTALAGKFTIASDDLASVGNVTLTGRNERGETITLIECPMTLSARFVSGTFESEGGRAGEFAVRNVACGIGTSFTTQTNGSIIGTQVLGGENLPGRPELVTGFLTRVANQEFLITNAIYKCLYRGTYGWLINWLWFGGTTYAEELWSFLPSTTLTLVATLAPSPLCPSGNVHIQGIFSPFVSRLIRL